MQPSVAQRQTQREWPPVFGTNEPGANGRAHLQNSKAENLAVVIVAIEAGRHVSAVPPSFAAVAPARRGAGAAPAAPHPRTAVPARICHAGVGAGRAVAAGTAVCPRGSHPADAGATAEAMRPAEPAASK